MTDCIYFFNLKQKSQYMSKDKKLLFKFYTEMVLYLKQYEVFC